MGKEIRVLPERQLPVPYGRFSFSGVGVLATFVVWLMEQHLTNWFGDVWSTIPFLWLAAVFLALLVGQVWADWTNDRSALKQWWYRRLAIFDLIDVWTPSEVKDGDELIHIKAKIRFRKNNSQTTAMLAVTGCLNQDSPPAQNFNIILWSGENVVAGQEKDITIITTSTKREGEWGGDQEKTLVRGSKNIADIMVSANRKSQAFKIRIDLPDSGGACGRFWYFDDTRDVFRS
jgi:hypothetical protein